MPIDYEQRKYLAAKVCRMQRDLARLVEHLYQKNVPLDNKLQLLAVRALDDVQRLQLHFRSVDLGLFPISDDAA